MIDVSSWCIVGMETNNAEDSNSEGIVVEIVSDTLDLGRYGEEYAEPTVRLKVGGKKGLLNFLG